MLQAGLGGRTLPVAIIKTLLPGMLQENDKPGRRGALARFSSPLEPIGPRAGLLQHLLAAQKQNAPGWRGRFKAELAV
jgi:hypothetical protein